MKTFANYKNYTLDDITRDLYNMEDSRFSQNAYAYMDILISTPYDRLKKHLTDRHHSGEKVIEDLFAALTTYYKNFDKNTEFTPHFTIPSSDVFDAFNNKMNDKEFNPYGMSAKGKMRLLRDTYINMEAQKASTNTRNHVRVFGYNGFKISHCSIIIDKCITDLLQQDRTFRGSSDAYKEIQKELNDLKKVCNAKNPSTSTTLYIAKMMRVIADKAEKYVADRNKIGYEHSINGYKGRRIAAMRSVADTLKQYSAGLQEGIEEHDYNPCMKEEKAKCKKLLINKAGKTTFNSRLFAEIKSLEDGRDIEEFMETPAIKAMNKGLKHTTISYEKMNSVHKTIEDNHYNILAGLSKEKNGNKIFSDNYLKKNRADLKKTLSGYSGGVNLNVFDNMIYEEEHCLKLTGDNVLDPVKIADTSNRIEEEADNRGIAFPSYNVYCKYDANYANMLAEKANQAPANVEVADNNIINNEIAGPGLNI